MDAVASRNTRPCHPMRRKREVATVTAKAKTACHSIVEVSRDRNMMLFAHCWLPRKNWWRSAPVEGAAMRATVRRAHKTCVQVVRRLLPAMSALGLKFLSVSRTAVLAEHLVRDAVMAKRYALPANRNAS